MSQTVEQTTLVSASERFRNVNWSNTWKNDDSQQQKKVFNTNFKKTKEESGEFGNKDKTVISYLLDNSKNPVSIAPSPSPSSSSAPIYTQVQYLNLNVVGSDGWSMNNTDSVPSQKWASTTIVPPSKTISPQIPTSISSASSIKISPVLPKSNNTHSNNHNLRRKSSEISRETTPDSSSNENPSSMNGGIEEEISNQNLYKTELCRSWKETGQCRYGQKCQFAHGEHEMRLIMRHPKYKTESCKTYAAFGSCPYKERCRFLHPEDSSLSRLSSSASFLQSAKTPPSRNESPSPPSYPQQSSIQASSAPFPVASASSSSSFLSTERSRLSIFQSLTEE